MSTTLSVHRCRFVDYSPSAVTAVAFPPLPLPRVKGKEKITDTPSFALSTLAVGRANGNIELHKWTGTGNRTQAPQAWSLQTILPGPFPSKVDSLVFALRKNHSNQSKSILHPDGLRLFSAGGGSEILEWNLQDGTILRSESSQAGTVWSMAVNPSSTLLALGCEDGSVRILSLTDESLVHHRRFDRVKSRLLSIAWGPPIPRQSSHLTNQPKSGHSSSEEEDEAEEWVDVWLAVGCSDSSLRKFDVASGRVLDRMTTDKARGERTLVWAVGVLGDGTIVSGDSLGTVKFWDPMTCTQLQSFQAHNADVLCLTIGPEGRSVYTSGVDQKVCQFCNVHVSAATERALFATSQSRWIQAGSRRLHSHDVRTLTVWPPHVSLAAHYLSAPSSAVAPVLVSGGLDMSLVICPCALPSLASLNVVNPIASSPISTFEDAYHRRMPYSTGISPSVQVAREAKLVLSRREKELTLWRIKKNASLGEMGLMDLENIEMPREDDWEKIMDMELKVQTNLIASAISNDGGWIAASDLYETKLFRLLRAKTELSPKRVKFSEEDANATTGATSLAFTADASKLIVGASMGKSLIVVVDLAGNNNDRPRVLRRFEHHRVQNVVVRGMGNVAKNKLSLDPDVEEFGVEAGPPDSEVVQSYPRYTTGASVATTIVCVAASFDGQWLASADTQHRIHIFNLDSVQHHCALPSFPQPIAALSFDPATPSVLVIGFVNNTLQVFNVESRQFASLHEGILDRIEHLHDPLLGIVFDPATIGKELNGAHRALLWGSSWMCRVNISAPAKQGGSSRKRRRESIRHSDAMDRGEENGPAVKAVDEEIDKLVTRYRSLLLVDFVGPGELVVIERPLVDLLSTLPPAFFKHTYGS